MIIYYCKWTNFFNFVLIFIISILLIPFTTLSGHSEPTQTYTFYITMDSEKIAHVGPSDDGIVIFNGTIEVECTQPTVVVVELSVEDTWYTSSIDPTTMYFRRTGEQSFTVQVAVPQGECCETLGIVLVHYNSRLYGSGGSGIGGSMSGFINVAQYYDLSLSSTEPNIETTPGSTNQLDLVIKNTGNGNDTFSVDILNDNNFNVRLSSTLIDISMNENETIQAIINIPSTPNVFGNHEIVVQVASIKGLEEGMQPRNYSFELNVKESIEPQEPDNEAQEPNNEENEDVEDSNNQKDTAFSIDTPYLIVGFLFIIIVIILAFLLRIKARD